MFRKKIKNRAQDRRIFQHTAQKVNTVNISQLTARGGTRM